MLTKMVFSLLAASCLSAAPQAIVFDWGKVLADPDRAPIVSFLCATLGMASEEFEAANLLRKDSSLTETAYWMNLAKQRGRALPEDWQEQYRSVSFAALNVDEKMYALVEELKASGIPVALLSNIQKKYGDLIRSFGLYEPFFPCLLSGEMGVAKPDPLAFDILLNELSLPAENVVFIDDKPENIEAAKSAGIDAILFESREQLQVCLQERGLLRVKEANS